MRVAVSVAALALAAALLLRPAAPGASAPPPRTEQRPARPAAAPSAPAVAAPARDIFSYSSEDEGGLSGPVAAGDGDAATLSAPPPLHEPAPPAAAEGPRLVGLVRRAGTLKAALFVDGEVVVVGPGDRAGGYRVVAVDEEEGVRLVDEAGTMVTLPPPP